jgi:hypothetical protein
MEFLNPLNDGIGVRNACTPVMQRNVKTKLLLMVIMPGWLSQSDHFNPVFNPNTITRIRILRHQGMLFDGAVHPRAGVS